MMSWISISILLLSRPNSHPTHNLTMRLRRGTREFLSIGLPMLLGVVGSSLLLTHFMKGKYRLLDNKRGSVSQPQYEEMKRQHQRKPFSLEEEYEVRGAHRSHREWRPPLTRVRHTWPRHRVRAENEADHRLGQLEQQASTTTAWRGVSAGVRACGWRRSERVLHRGQRALEANNHQAALHDHDDDHARATTTAAAAYFLPTPAPALYILSHRSFKQEIIMHILSSIMAILALGFWGKEIYNILPRAAYKACGDLQTEGERDGKKRE